MAHVTEARIGGTSFLSTLGGLRDDMSSRIAQYRTYRTTLNELRSLSTRELNDLGLAYADLRSIAIEATYAK